MRKSTITLAYDEHRNRGVVSLCFEKKFLTGWSGHGISGTIEIYTHVSQKDFAKFKNPFDDDFFDSS